MLLLSVSNKTVSEQFEHADGPIEIGRGPQRDTMPRYTVRDDLYVSKDHVKVEELAAGQIRFENLSKRNPVWFGDGQTLPPGETTQCAAPLRITVGETAIVIESVPADPVLADALSTLARAAHSSKILAATRTSLAELGKTPDAATLAHWLETVIAVQRAAADSSEFYQQTAQAVVDLVGLDRGLIIMRRGDRWEIVARAAKSSLAGREFSQTIINQVVKERRTFFQSSVNEVVATSLQGVEAVVASPIFDARDEVVGAVYGSRSRVQSGIGLGIGSLEAQVVQLLASAVGAGLARLQQEAEASRLRVQFEQFFTPDLANELQRNPRLLDGQERTITVMFTDIRGFSRLSERMSPRETCRLVHEVMTAITTHVRAQEGVVVDYSGDGMMAMWNAPTEQAEHAARACRAARAIQAALPRVASEWRDHLGGKLNVGVGIHTGPVLVGNTGSRHKFAYGPMGPGVNLAARIEGATKSLGIPTLITGATRALLSGNFATRRLCTVQFSGIADPVELHELHSEEANAEWAACRDTYESALALFEAGQWADCYRAMYPLPRGVEGAYDIPSLNLLNRSLVFLRSSPLQFNPTMNL